MFQILRAWPFLLAILCVLYDNKVVIPILYGMDLDARLYYGIPIGLAAVELFYWNWFIGWFGRWIKDQERAREAYRRFWDEKFGKKIRVLAEAIRDWVLRFIHELLHGEGHWKGWKGRLLVWCVTKLPKIMAYPIIFIMGIVPGGWVVAIPICRSNKIPFGFSTLLTSCLLTNWALAYFGKEWLFAKIVSVANFLPIGATLLIILFVLLVASTKIKRKILEIRADAEKKGSP